MALAYVVFLRRAFLRQTLFRILSPALWGAPFQSPFAKPPGKGLSSATVNVVWGFFNAVVAYLLVAQVGAFHPRATSHISAFGLGVLLISIFSARHFGQFHGGNAPTRT